MSNSMTRRQVLRLFAIGSGGALLAACSPAVPPTTAPTQAPAAKAEPATAPSAAQAPAAPAAPAKPISLVDHLYEGAKKEGKVVWWDQHEARVAQKFMDAFKKQYPGIEVEYFESSQDEVKPRAIAEARAGRVSFDMLDTGQNYPAYKEVGIVTSNPDLLRDAGVPLEQQYEGTYSPEWTVYLASFNTNLVKLEELPRNWEGFLDPKWKGKLALEQRLRPFVYGTPFLGGEEKVSDYLRRLKEQNPRFTKGNTDTDTLLVAGEFQVAIGTYLHNYQKFKPRNQPWDFVRLDEVYTSQPGPGYTVPEAAPHPNAGRLFLHWFVGPQGTQLMDSERFKGSPLPGSGTGPSKLLEENKMTVKVSPLEYELNYSKYEQKYLEALGLPVR